MRHVARELAAVGHAVVVWTVDRGEHLGTQHRTGIEVRYLPAPLPARSARGLITYAARSPQAWRRWLRAHRDFQPDALHVQCFGPNGVYALALHYLFTTPLVVSSHGETFADDAARPLSPAGASILATSRCEPFRIRVGASFSPTSEKRNSISRARPFEVTLGDASSGNQSNRSSSGLRNSHRCASPVSAGSSGDGNRIGKVPNIRAGQATAPDRQAGSNAPCRTGVFAARTNGS